MTSSSPCPHRADSPTRGRPLLRGSVAHVASSEGMRAAASNVSRQVLGGRYPRSLSGAIGRLLSVSAAGGGRGSSAESARNDWSR